MSRSFWKNFTCWILHDWQEMKKIIILIPIFNDWDSLKKLINEINESIQNYKSFNFKCIIINDASTIKQPELTKPKNINSFQILNMKKNRGHARCNAFGIRYIYKNENFDNLILMDGDGEDRPIEIKNLLDGIINNDKISIVAKRVKRSEGFFFKLLYQGHKILTFIFTGKNVAFGNFSCLTKIDVEVLQSKASLWSSYSGTVKKNLKDLGEINLFRGSRYFGPSQMSLFKLIIHSFSIIAVFKYQVFLRSTFMIIFLAFINKYLGNTAITFQVFIVFFNIIIFIISLRERESDLENSHNNLDKIVNITHQ